MRTVKRKLEAIRCPKDQRVHLAAHQLSGMALSWWDTFSVAVRNATWVEFEAAFREHHVPLGIVQLKEEEFWELTHGGRSVSENTSINSQNLLVMHLMMSARKPRRWLVS